MPGILDIDLSKINDPNQPAPDGTYRLEIVAAENKVNEQTGSAGAVFRYSIVTPGDNQGKQFGEYVNIVKKDGSVNPFGAWQVKKMCEMKGLKKGKLSDHIPHLVGLQFDAELETTEPEQGSQYGPQNAIKRMLA